jgi:hypothetical protein
MRYRLDADHYDEFNLLPAGTIVGDGCEVSWKYLPTVADPKLRNTYKPPSMEMTPLDEEARQAYNERFGLVPPEKDPTNKIPLFGGIDPSDTGSAAPHTIAFTGKPTVAPPGRPNPAPNNPTEKPTPASIRRRTTRWRRKTPWEQNPYRAQALRIPSPQERNNLATSQASVTTGNIQAAAARTGRQAITITNVTGTSAIYCGVTGVTTSTGAYIGATAGSNITLNTSAAVFCTVAATTQTVTVAETF